MTAQQPLFPSYAKLILTLVVIVLGMWFPVKVLKVDVDIRARRSDPDQPGGGSEAPPANRLFDEYPEVAADRTANPDETRSALWISFRHLAGAERPAAMAVWRPAGRLRTLSNGLYRLDCRGPLAVTVTRVLTDYPYAIAPAAGTDPSLAAAYRQVTAASPFRVCVVHGDWLAATLANEPAADGPFGLLTSPPRREQYLANVLAADVALAPFPLASRGRVAAPSTLTRRELEAADGSGHSLFVRWAMATGVGVPVY